MRWVEMRWSEVEVCVGLKRRGLWCAEAEICPGLPWAAVKPRSVLLWVGMKSRSGVKRPRLECDEAEKRVVLMRIVVEPRYVVICVAMGWFEAERIRKG